VDPRFLNDGLAGLTPTADGPFHTTGGSAIELVDIDQDGDLDVIAGSWAEGDHFLLNDGTAGFSLVDGELEGESEAQLYQSVFAAEHHEQSSTGKIIAVDLDLDGDLDLLFCKHGAIVLCPTFT
jgi:hypothetical protein